MAKCILIFDDDEEILEVCRLILEKQNYRVVVKTNCDGIIEHVQEIKPELILMDLRIPEIGGEKAIELIRNTRDIAFIPIILFSANMGIQSICERLNVNGYLPKPFDIEALISIVRKHTLQ